MTAQKPCLYCGSCDSSDEHVISEALGCKETISSGVCGPCNNTFGHGFEGEFVNGLALFLNFFRIKNGHGVVPSVPMTAKIDAQEFRFVVTGDGRAECPPQLLARGHETSGGSDRKFRLFHKEQERKIERDLRSKHPSVKWDRLREQQTKVVFDAQPAFDVQMLHGSDASLSLAKYAVNLLVHQYGYDWAKERCVQLISLVKGARPSSVRSGVFWEPGLLRQFPFAPPKHLVVIVSDARSRTVVVFLYLFCLLPFCVLAEGTDVSVDSIRTLALDPGGGRFTPLFLDGSPAVLEPCKLPPFPMPEFEFSRVLRSVEIGGPKQANLAAANALGFMREYSSGSQVPHLLQLPKDSGRTNADLQILRHAPSPRGNLVGNPPCPALASIRPV